MKNLVELDEFTADVTVPEDNDDATAASVEAPFQALANRTQHLKNLAPAYPIVIPASAFTPGSGAVDSYSNTTDGANFFYMMVIAEANGYAKLDLAPYLVSGLTIDTIEVRAKPGTARSGSNRMEVRLAVSDFADGVGDAATSYTANDNATANEQVITLSPAAVVDKTAKSYSLFIRTGNNGNDYPDAFYNVRLTCSAP